MIEELKVIRNEVKYMSDDHKKAYDTIVNYFARNILEAVKEQSKSIKDHVKDNINQIKPEITFYVISQDKDYSVSRNEIKATLKMEAKKKFQSKNKDSKVKWITFNKNQSDIYLDYYKKYAKLEYDYDKECEKNNSKLSKDEAKVANADAFKKKDQGIAKINLELKNKLKGINGLNSIK